MSSGPRKPCPDCGGPKPPGKGRHRCEPCEVIHKAEQNKRRNEGRRKGCVECGKPKLPGRGLHRCAECQRVYVDKNSGRVRIVGKWGAYVYRYRQVMEEHLGRPLSPDETVHHINGDQADDRIENLQLLTRSEHGRLHGIQSGEVRRAKAAA